MVAVNALRDNTTALVDFVQIGHTLGRAQATEPCEYQTADEVINAKCKHAFHHLIVMDVTQSGMGSDLKAVLKSQAKKGTKLVAIDSLPGLENSLDLLYAPSFFAPHQTSRIIERVNIVYGWDCYLLDVCESPDFVKPHPGSVLVMTGGSDVHELGQKWPAMIDKELASNIHIHWVTGPFSAKPEIPRNPRLGWHEHTGMASLGELFRRAEFALTLYGVGFFELLASGVPTVVYSPYGERDKSELEEIERMGLSEVAWSAEQAVQSLAAITTDEKRKEAIQKKIRGLNMTYRAGRFVAELKKLLSYDQQLGKDPVF